ncbi:hypothetical protein FND36_02985 [Lachnospiraceae bacterium KGMB03038]|nr:hypothetical protein FND36_02985 [Lachnospiraceae bacterium KGMB03038]
MKIIFNDATELQVQQVQQHGDYLRILTVSATPDQLRGIFEDQVKTANMVVEERGQRGEPLDGYTTFYRTEEYTGQIYGVVMYKPDRTPEIQTEKAQAAVLVAQIQAQELTDEQAITVKAIYPQWSEIIGQTVALGYKFLYGDVLYKTIQDSLLIQEQYIPGEGTESLYTVIDETHAGTQEDPIPYGGNMALESGKYYIQDETVYKCTRDTEIPVYNALADLIGIYVEVAE